MREIKFRAWDKKEREMWDVIQIAWDDNHKPYVAYLGKAQPYGYTLRWFKIENGWINNRDRFVLMQYTGLKDKNGKEIYEGDIVQYKTYYAVKRWWRYSYEIPLIEQEMEKQRKDWHYEKGVIKIVDGCVKLNSLTGPNIAFGEKTEIGSNYWSDYEQKWWDFEVIGNIYENPELLEE